eukprot:m.146821 g.146821  ORF g.146821 m.146821 type:complete len:301 (+) comp14160_c0_seq1:2759-3661(+)
MRLNICDAGFGIFWSVSKNMRTISSVTRIGCMTNLRKNRSNPNCRRSIKLELFASLFAIFTDRVPTASFGGHGGTMTPGYLVCRFFCSEWKSEKRRLTDISRFLYALRFVLAVTLYTTYPPSISFSGSPICTVNSCCATIGAWAVNGARFFMLPPFLGGDAAEAAGFGAALGGSSSSSSSSSSAGAGAGFALGAAFFFGSSFFGSGSASASGSGSATGSASGSGSGSGSASGSGSGASSSSPGELASAKSSSPPRSTSASGAPSSLTSTSSIGGGPSSSDITPQQRTTVSILAKETLGLF